MTQQPFLERWKYTDLSALQAIAWQSLPKQPAENAIIFAESDDQGPVRLVFVDGQLDQALSQLDRIPDDTHVISQVIQNTAEALTVGKVTMAPSQSQTNTEIVIAENAVIEPLIYLLSISTEQSHQCVLPMQLTIKLGQHAKAAIQCEYVSYRDVQSFHQLNTNIELERGAELQHYCVQKENDQAFYWQQKTITQFHDSEYSAFDLMLGGLWARLDVKHHLAGDQARCRHHGFYYSNEKRQHNVYLDVHHEQPDCKSEQYFKGIIDDQAHAVFNTKVTVTENGQGSHAAQDNHNLLLSSKAEIDTKPDLEIYNDDVACSHGATVGNLSQDALFYLRSRGIDEVQARTLLTHSFAVELLEQIQQPLVQAGMKAELMAVLGD